MYSSDRVRFDKPDLDYLNKTYTVVDTHFHSTYSDGLSRIDKIAERARQLGIGIAVTDHNEIRGALEIDQYEDILSIPGIELTVSEGSHLLVYFYEVADLQRFYENEIVAHMGSGVMTSLSLSMEEAIERARRYRCVVIFPHPYCAMYTGICNAQFSETQRQGLFQMVDGIEAINANNLNKWNLKCAVLGFNLDSAMVGGSDGHALSHMGRAVTYAECPRTRHDFLNAVLQKNNQVMGKEITFLRKVTSNGLKLRCNLTNYPDLIEKNLRYGRKVLHLKTQAVREQVRRGIEQHLKPRRLRSYFGI
jgi:predicted metal-dependent phosphoesterase TrpH